MSLALALEWAAAGCRVLPVNGSNKRPLIKEWQVACTTDEETIKEWWREYPQARVGVATGEPGFDVLDFDVAGGKPGLAQLEKLIDLGVIGPGTFRVAATPSGGRHLWFAGTDQRNKQNDKSIPGVDFRGVGGMVLVPGNPGYRWVTGGSIPASDLKQLDWSAVVAALVQPVPADQPVLPPRPTPPAQPTPTYTGKLVAPLSFDNDPGSESPLDWYCNNNDLNDLLRRDGWRWMYESGGRQYWCRPGKDPKDGASANVMINPNDGRQTLMNFSTSVDLPTDRGLSAAQYYAYREHGGDVRGAAGAIRRTMMPRPQETNRTAVAGTGAPVAPTTPPVATRSAELVPYGVETPEPVKTFWEKRPVLREVWFQSQVGGASPWAVLGTILGQVAARVGPHVVLPPLGDYGAAASLNLLIAISGNTGEGKGMSKGVAKGFVGRPYPPALQIGTGQGVAAMFTTMTKEGPVQEHDTVYIAEDEISNMGAHMSQQGATLKSTLLKVYMAEELGEHYANKELRRPVHEGCYRLALVVGVQPDNAGILFDHAASGLPQRFLWMPAHWDDAVLPVTDLVPPAPGPALPSFKGESLLLPGSMDDSLEATGWSPSDAAGGLSAPRTGKKDKEPQALPVPVKDPIVVTYAPKVGREIRRAHLVRQNAIKLRNQTGEENAGDPDSHLQLTKIKVATYLAIWLDGVTHISDEIWGMAAVVIGVSNDTRVKAHNRILRNAATKAASRTRSKTDEAEALEVRQDEKRMALVKATAEKARAVLQRTPGVWATTGDVNKGIRYNHRLLMKAGGVELLEVLEEMASLGEIERHEVERSGNLAVEWRK